MTEPTIDTVCDDHAQKGHCALHRLLWEHHDNDRREHRTALCDQILMLSNSITAMVPRWVFVLTTVAGFSFSLLIFGWLANSVTKGQTDLKNEIIHVAALVQRVNVRITETVNDRIASDVQQLQKLEAIDGKMGTVNWRLCQIEEAHKPVNKFVPDNKSGKPN